MLKRGFELSQATVSKYLARPRRPRSQSWQTFLTNLAKDIVSIDVFTLPTVTFPVLHVFLVLECARRRIIHFNVTEPPTATWTRQQIVEEFPWGTAPRYLIRDRDGMYVLDFDRRVASLDIKKVLVSSHLMATQFLRYDDQLGEGENRSHGAGEMLCPKCPVVPEIGI